MSDGPVPDEARTPSPDEIRTEQPTVIERPGSGLEQSIDFVVDVSARGFVPLSRLADYELIAEIGRGGMGVVFKARHVRLNRVVALKMILGGALARADDLHRFDTEAAAAAQLQHPGIVALYEIGSHDSQPYFCMEYISGSSLAQRVNLGPLPSRRAALYLEATARAVHYAHTRGIIHRDLKPANVLLDEHENPKVTDFGLAKLLTTDSGQTRTGAVLGTPSYMSPEQAGGRKDVGPASDVYSLGAILYELLTGKPPFQAETPLATLTLVAEQEPVPPRLLNPSVDRDLETICLKCLEKDPTRRYQSAEALADDLRRYLDEEPIAARRVGVLGRTIKWCRRKPALASLIAVSVFAVLALLALQWQVAVEERELREIAVHREREALVRQEALRHFFYLGHIRQVQRALESADLDRAQRLLNRWREPQGQSDLRGWEWFFLQQQLQGAGTLSGHAGRATAVAYHPDGKRLASAGGEPAKPGEIKIWDRTTGKVLHTLLGHDNLVTAVAFSEDGKYLASASFDWTVRLWSADDGTPLTILMGHKAQVTSVAFHPGSQRLASASADQTVRLWSLPPAGSVVKEAVLVLQGHTKEVSAVAFSPVGDLLASGSLDRSVKLWDPIRGTPLHELSGHEGEVHAVAFSVGGKILASGGGRGSRRGEVRLWTSADGQLLASRYGLSDRVLALAFSREGKLAAGASDGTVRVWDQTTSSEAAEFRADPQLLFGLAFRPDGLQLATAGRNGRIRLWHSSGGQETLSLPAPGPVGAVACSLEGGRLAFSTRSSAGPEIHVWSLAPARHLLTLKAHSGPIHALAFSASGQRLASGGDDRSVRVHDLEGTDRQPLILKGHGAPVKTVAFRPDGVQIASGSADDTIRLWDAHTGSLERVLTGANEILALAYSPDSSVLASASYDKNVRVWDLASGSSRTLSGHTGSTNAVVFSPDGKKLVSGSSDRTIREWDLTRLKDEGMFKDKILEGSPGPVLALAFHPRGRRLASAGQDRTVRIWDMVTREEILDLDGPSGPLQSIAFSGDGRWLACAGPGNVVRLWDAPP